MKARLAELSLARAALGPSIVRAFRTASVIPDQSTKGETRRPTSSRLGRIGAWRDTTRAIAIAVTVSKTQSGEE